MIPDTYDATAIVFWYGLILPVFGVCCGPQVGKPIVVSRAVYMVNFMWGPNTMHI